MIGDTIYAPASAPGQGARGIVRISGPLALALAARLVPAGELLPRARAAYERSLALSCGALPGLLLVMPGPRSFTGEDTVEVHGPGSPLWLAELGRALEAGGARLALPGEFTRRAVAAGRTSLEQAEGLLALIEADTAQERRLAQDILRGEVGRLIACASQSLVTARAVLESGLDFTEGETGEVEPEDWLPLLRSATGGLRAILDQAPAARPGGQVALIGAANAGKSSLCNALAGRAAMLVSDGAGTTRDVVAVTLPGGEVVLDGPGDLADAGALDAAALTLRDRHLHSVAAALLVVDVSAPKWCVPAIPVAALVLTKCDRLASGEPPPAVPSAFADLPRFTTSARSGAGLESLREFVRACARPGHAARAMPLLAGCDRALAAVDRAIALGAAGAAPELAAVELAEALTQLEDSRGRGGAEEVLDQIFGRFCLGK